MIDTKKEQERDELHRAIWAIADELRGAVDGWDFKNYVLGTMFYRYISENLTNYINSGEQDAGNADFDYAKMPDVDAEEAREGLVEEKGFFIPPSELFCNVNSKADNDENLNETLESVFNHIESSAKGSSSESSFISHVNVDTHVTTEWRRFVLEQEETDLTEIITSEKLKPEETRKFVANAFRDGALKTTGTEIDKLMPPVSRFGGGGRAKKKQGVIEKLKAFFEKYFGLGIAEFRAEEQEQSVVYEIEPTYQMVVEEPAPYGTKEN